MIDFAFVPNGSLPSIPSLPIVVFVVFLISGLPQKSLTLHIRGKSTTCVDLCGKRRVGVVSKWEKPVHFPISFPPFPRLTHIPDRLGPDRTISPTTESTPLRQGRRPVML